MRTAPDITTTDQRHLMATLDLVANLNGSLTADSRARIFAAAADGTHQAWVASRSAILNAATMETLWQAVARTQGVAQDACDTPERHHIIAALEEVAVDISMGSLLI